MAEIDNVKLAEQFNKLFSERRVLAAAVTREMRNQLDLAVQLATIVDNKKPEELAEKLAAVTQAMKVLKEQTQEAGGQADKAMQAVASGSKGAAKGVNDVDKHMKVLVAKFPALKSAAAGAFNGLVQGFKNVIAVGTSAIGIAGGFADGVFKIGKSILAIPLKIFRGLIDLATSFSGDTSFLQALENLRKEFGNFKEDMSKNVLGAFKTAQAGITGTGLSTFRVLGTFAQQLEYFTEIAKQAGPQFHEFGKSIADEAGKFVAFEKGLGIGADHVKSFLDRAKTMGTTWQDEFGKTANYSLQMGEAFGLSQKVIGKDIAMMMKDVKNFSSLTQKEMSVAAVYTRKLGIEVKNLLGLVDKFDTFEDSATAAAQMSQAFGTAVDAFKLMQEQDPAKRMDMLRKSMAAAGKTTENMSRQELKLLAQTSGLDEATAKLAFSAKNQGVSYDQVAKKAAEAENAPLRQAQALEKLAASIERVVMQGQMFKGGFIDQFLHGFQLGIKNSPAFMGAILSIRTALLQTMYAGVEVGKMFVKTFAGGSVEATFKGIKEVFTGWDKVMNNVKTAFASFFVDFDIDKLIKNFQTIFLSHFNSKGKAGTAMAEGMKGMFDGLVKVAASGLTYIVKHLTDGFERLAEFVKNPVEFLNGMKSGGKSMAGSFISMLDPLIKVFENAELWNKLYGAFTDAMSSIWERIKKWIHGPTFQAIIMKIGPTILGMLMAPSLIRGAAGGAAGLLAKAFLNTGSAAADTAIAGAVKMGATNPAGPKIMTSIFGNPYTAAAALVAAAAVAGTGFSKGAEKYSDKLVQDATVAGTKAEKQVGASLAGLVQMLSFGAISDEAGYNLAKNFSKYAGQLFAQIEKIFGPHLGKAMKDRLMIQLDFLTHFGDLIRNVMSGNGEGIIKSLGNLFADMFRMAFTSVKMIFLDMPAQIISWAIPMMNKLSDYLKRAMDPSSGEVSVWEQVKPVLAKVGTEMLGPLWESLKNLFSAAFIKLPPVLMRLTFYAIGFISKTITDAFISLGKSIWNGLVDVIVGLAEKTTGIFGDKLKGMLEQLKNTLKFAPKLTPDNPKDVADALAKDREKKMNESLANRPPPAAAITPKGQEDAGEDQSNKLMKAQQSLEGLKALQELQKVDIQKTINDASAKMESINMDKINTGLLDRVSQLNETMTKLSQGLETSSKDVEARLAPTIKATQDIIASVKELDNILASGDASRISVTKNLSKFANKAGLGGNDKYTIQNKGIQINLDLKVVMNAEELEEALVLRNKSIIKDSIKSSLSLTDDQLRDRIRNH